MVFALLVFLLVAAGIALYLRGLTESELNAIIDEQSSVSLRLPWHWMIYPGVGAIYLILRFWHLNALWQEDKKPEEWWRIRLWR
jgi:hypothetical protein